MIDLVALLVLAAFGVLGAWRGALESAFRLLALAAGYGLAVLAALRAGGDLAASLGVPPWLGSTLAATGAFVASQILFGVGALVIRSAERRRLAEGARSVEDRTLGAVLGLFRGGAVVLLVGWLLLFVDALRVSGVATGLPDLSGASLPPLAGRVAEGTARAVLGAEGPAERVVTRMAGRPGETARRLRAVLEHDRVRALQADAGFWLAVEQGNVEGALGRASLRRLSADPALRRDLAALGVIDASEAASADRFRAALGEALAEMVPRLQQLRRDPEVQALLADREVQGLLRSGDAVALLAREDFRGVVSRALEAPPGP